MVDKSETTKFPSKEMKKLIEDIEFEMFKNNIHMLPCMRKTYEKVLELHGLLEAQ